MRAINYVDSIKKYLGRLGSSCVIERADGSVMRTTGVIWRLWRKNTSKYQPVSTKIGRVGTDYYMFLCPSDTDITVLNEKDTVVIEGVSYCFVKTDPVIVGGIVQYYSGVLKKLAEVDCDVFE